MTDLKRAAAVAIADALDSATASGSSSIAVEAYSMADPMLEPYQRPDTATTIATNYCKQLELSLYCSFTTDCHPGYTIFDFDALNFADPSFH